MIKYIVGILSLYLLLFSCSDPAIEITPNIECASYSIQHTKSARFQNIINKYITLGLPGISVLVESDAEVFVGSGGFADIEEGVAFTPCHISKAASITKLMVGTLTMILQEDGILNIDNPISMYIDNSILDRLENSKEVTIRQLMSHTTGIFDLITSSEFYLAVLNNPTKDWRQEELLKYAYDKEGVEFVPPNTSSYSNTNTVLLSMCIEAATGRDHGELLRERIINPLSMNNTYYQGREDVPNAAQGYFDLHNNGTIVNVSNLITGSGNGYGGIFSNVSDLNIFIHKLLVEKTIISDASLHEMQKFHLAREDFFTGAGMIKKFTAKSAFGIGHTGRDLAYSADLFYFPQVDIKMVFFVNYGTNGTSSLKEVFEDFESELVDLILE